MRIDRSKAAIGLLLALAAVALFLLLAEHHAHAYGAWWLLLIPLCLGLLYLAGDRTESDAHADDHAAQPPAVDPKGKRP